MHHIFIHLDWLIIGKYKPIVNVVNPKQYVGKEVRVKSASADWFIHDIKLSSSENWSCGVYHPNNVWSMNSSPVSSPPKPVSFERQLKSWKIEYNSKWNQSYLSRGSNSLNSASDYRYVIFYILSTTKDSRNIIWYFVFKCILFFQVWKTKL